MIKNLAAFFESQSDELASRANRVRHLIGDAHWYTDGSFKEALLIDALRIRLPSGMVARRGFVLATDLSESSKEQDCVIADRTTSAPIFDAVDFHMVGPHSVSGLVSVKTRLEKKAFVEAVVGIASALRIVANEPLAGNPFAAIFFFDEESSVRDSTIIDWIRELRTQGHWPVRRTDAIDGDGLLGPLYVFTLRSRCIRIDQSTTAEAGRVRFYSLPNIAAALFLHLLEKTLFDQRQSTHSPAWGVLDDAKVATLTTTIEL